MHTSKKYYILGILLWVPDILQTTVQPSHKPFFSLTLDFLVLVRISNTTRNTKNIELGRRLIATPAIRTLKISVFYPKNSQKSQIILLVGSRHTSDDSPTVTQIYLFLLSCFCFVTNVIKQKKKKMFIDMFVWRWEWFEGYLLPIAKSRKSHIFW